MTEDQNKRPAGGLIELQMSMLEASHKADSNTEKKRKEEAAEVRIAILERRVRLLLKASSEHATRLRALERGGL